MLLPGKTSLSQTAALIMGVLILSPLICLQVQAQSVPRSNFGAYTRPHFDAGAYYSPPLPPPKFLDSRQEDLSSKGLLKASDYVYFADAVDPEKPELSDLRYELKPWTQREKDDIDAILDRLAHIAPGLLIKAASSTKL